MQHPARKGNQESVAGAAVRRVNQRWSHLSESLLLLLALILPFELKSPLWTIGALEITNVELVWYLLLFVWGIGKLRAPSFRWTFVHSAVVLWALVIALSAVLAPTDRVAVLKFAVRSFTGCALFIAAADMVGGSRRAARLILALALGAALSAFAAVAEVWIPEARAISSEFRTAPIFVGGFQRATGTFQYPNIGAMYWEAALPLTLAGALWFAARNTPWARWVGVLGCVLLAAAIVLSASRASVIVAFLLFAAMIAVRPASIPGMRVPATVGMLALLALTTASDVFRLRLQGDEMTTWYRAEYSAIRYPDRVRAGDTFAVTVAVRNAGLATWKAGGDHSIRLGYCWNNPTTRSSACAKARGGFLLDDVAPRQEVELAIEVTAPAAPGSYRLQWDMMLEGISWFSSWGAQRGALPMAVESAGEGATVSDVHWQEPAVALTSPSRIQLWRAAAGLWRQRPLLGIGPDNFRRHYGEVLDQSHWDDRIHANSWYMETAATLGTVGVLALLAFMASLVVLARRAWMNADSDSHRPLVFAVVLALAAFFVHGLVDYFMSFTPTSGLFWLLTGTLVGLASSPSHQKSDR